MSLSDLQCRNAKPGSKVVKLSDGGGLQLWITPDGAKRWRLAYRIDGKQKVLAIGVYPAVGVKEAREAREVAKKLADTGQAPSAAKKIAKAARIVSNAATFEALADELLEKKRREEKATATVEKIEWLLGLARPIIGQRPIREITAPEILSVLRSVESRGATKRRDGSGQR